MVQFSMVAIISACSLFATIKTIAFSDAKKTVKKTSIENTKPAPTLRRTQLIGFSVFDDEHQAIGVVDDIHLSQPDPEETPKLMAVLSIGGSLGIKRKLVEVSYTKLRMNEDGEIVLPGATADSLNEMGHYDYQAIAA